MRVFARECRCDGSVYIKDVPYTSAPYLPYIIVPDYIVPALIMVNVWSFALWVYFYHFIIIFAKNNWLNDDEVS